MCSSNTMPQYWLSQKWDPEKSVSQFCGIFLTYPNASKSYGIRFLATKQHFQCPEIRIFHDFKNFYHFGDVFEHGWSQIPSQNNADTVSETGETLFVWKNTFRGGQSPYSLNTRAKLGILGISRIFGNFTNFHRPYLRRYLSV